MSWNGSILTLNGVSFETAASIALNLDSSESNPNFTINVTGTNSFTSTTTSGVAWSRGIMTYGNLTIKGTGTLTAVGGKPTGKESVGISVMQGAITIEDSVTVHAKGGANDASYGIDITKGIIMTDGTLFAKGNTRAVNISSANGTIPTGLTISGKDGSGNYTVNGVFQTKTDQHTICDNSGNVIKDAKITPSGGGSTPAPSQTAPDLTPTTTHNNIKVETNGTASYTATIKDNILTADVPEKSVNDSIEKLLKDLEENPEKVQVIEIKVSGASDEVKIAEFNLPNTAILNVVKKTDATLFIDAGKLGILEFDNNVLATIINTGKGDLRIITEDITNVTGNKLTDEQKATIGNNPVYGFKVFIGSTRVSEFGLGTVTVSLPYTPKTGENTNNIVIYYVDENGNIQLVENSKYDSKTGAVIFTTNHFSLYMIGKQFTVTYKANGGGTVFGMPSDKTKYDRGNTATVIGAPVSVSKFFYSWNTKADGTGKSYTAEKTFKITEDITLYAQWKNTVIGASKLKYKVTGKKEVACIGITDIEAISISIGNTITYKGITYKITNIAKNAFRGNEKITTVKIGNNVKTINNTAFYKCPNLKKITIGTGLITLGNNPFCFSKDGCIITINSTKLKTVKTAINHGTKNMVIKIPKSKLSVYKKLFAKTSKTITVEAK